MFGARREGFEDSEFGGSERRIPQGACRNCALHPKLSRHTSHLVLRCLVHLVLLYTAILLNPTLSYQTRIGLRSFPCAATVAKGVFFSSYY